MADVSSVTSAPIGVRGDEEVVDCGVIRDVRKVIRVTARKRTLPFCGKGVWKRHTRGAHESGHVLGNVLSRRLAEVICVYGDRLRRIV